MHRAAMLGYLQEVPGANSVDAKPARRDGSDLAIPASVAATELGLVSLAMAASDQP